MRAALVLVVLVAALAPAGRRGVSIARAEPSADATPAQVEALVVEGTRLADAGDNLGALARFDQAYALAPSPKIMLKRGVVLTRLGRRVAAAEAFAAYLDAEVGDPSVGASVAAQLAKLDATLGHLRIVVTGVAVAEVKVGDGPWADASTGTVRVEPGPFRVAARAGHADRAVAVEGTVEAGRTREVALDVTAPRARRRADAGRGGNRRPVAYGALGLGAATIVSGAVLLLVIDEEPVTTPTTDPTYTEATIPGAVTLGVGVALVGVGGYLLLHDRPRARRVSPVVAVGRGDAVVGVIGRF